MPQALPKIPVIDLLALPARPCLGRERELGQLARTLRRHDQPNAIITGLAGIGKTALWHGLVADVTNGHAPALPALPYLQLVTAALLGELRGEQTGEQMRQHLTAAVASLPPVVLIIDDADALLRELPEPWHIDQLLAPFTPESGRHLVLCCLPETYTKLQETALPSLRMFDAIRLTALAADTCAQIIERAAPHLAGRYGVTIERPVLAAVLEAAAQLPSLLAMPQQALTLFDEVCAAAVVHQQPVVTPAAVEQVMAQRLGLPSRRLSRSDKQALHDLPQRLARSVHGQDHVVGPVADVVKRGWLGLKNRQRPLGSFLFLGPSGVGKTELAKTLAREVFGQEQAFIRLDMSEFSEPHTAQRLTGAPPGYVGYEAGGQLTNPVLARPFSLILLDEIEKAHPSVFDLFLQVLDDGRLTDSHGTTVDFTHTIIIATSNIGLEPIIAAAEQGRDVGGEAFMKELMFPLLLQRFRAEFLNRFERLSVFAPLSPEALYAIAQLELAKITERFAHLHMSIQLDPLVLRHKIAELYNPRLGARPLKRYLESVCEAAVAERLLAPV